MMTGAIAFELPNTKICTQHVQYILLQPHELTRVVLVNYN